MCCGIINEMTFFCTIGIDFVFIDNFREKDMGCSSQKMHFVELQDLYKT